jgi:hypothetical protein
MPTLTAAASSLADAPPATFDADAHAILCAVWRTYPRAAAGWRSLFAPDQPTPKRWENLRDGTPLLDETMIRWDSAQLRQQHRRLQRLLLSPGFRELEALDDLRRHLAPRSYEPARWARLYLTTADDDPEPELLFGGYIIQPFLYQFARRVLPRLNQENWRRDRCPVCGGRPYHGYLHPQSRQRILVCTRCQCPWTAPRLRCPFCANIAQDSLGYFYLDRATRHRVDYCGICRSILPITLYPESQVPFPLHDHLDSMSLQNAIEGSRR